MVFVSFIQKKKKNVLQLGMDLPLIISDRSIAIHILRIFS